jgi:hypothetical protein
LVGTVLLYVLHQQHLISVLKLALLLPLLRCCCARSAAAMQAAQPDVT